VVHLKKMSSCYNIVCIYLYTMRAQMPSERYSSYKLLETYTYIIINIIVFQDILAASGEVSNSMFLSHMFNIL